MHESRTKGVKSVRSLMTYSALQNDTPWDRGGGQYMNPDRHIVVPSRVTHRMTLS